MRPTGSFKNSLQYAESSGDEENYRQYFEPKFRKLSIPVEVNYIIKHLSQEELEQLRERFEQLRRYLEITEFDCAKEGQIFIAASYMYKTPEVLASNMVLSVKDAAKRIEFTKQQKL